jgi:hypothetical protein
MNVSLLSVIWMIAILLNVIPLTVILLVFIKAGIHLTEYHSA